MRLRFGDFELDVRAGELRKHGLKIRLQYQSLQILLMLLERPGEVVLRDDIREKLWPNNTIVEFDHSINAAIKRLRNALGESAEDPRFVETLAKRGYRFVGEVIKDQPYAETPVAVADAADLTGKTFASYRLLAKLGEGGMGIVYRAEDIKLGRHVAVKFLPEQLASDATARQRFEREARAASALNHPGICAIFGMEEVGGQPAIVMELVEGETLASRMARGQLPREQALAVAVQVADAVAEAHRKGIVHRDLKPSNIMLTERSTRGIKILDFGIAKMEDGDTALTRPGLAAGTLKYMSPEQAEGKSTDSRSDIYSFGVVLNEMLTEKAALNGALSGPLERLVRRCLEHDREERWQSARDLKLELEWIAETQPEVRGRRFTLLPWIGVAILAVVATIGWWRRPESAAPRDMSFTIAPPSGKELAIVGGLGNDRISPDGSVILFRTRDRRYYVRRLNSFESELLSEWAFAGEPCWAPDSQSIAFPTDGGRLMKMRIPKGAPQLVAQDIKGAARGATWNEQGIILIAQYSNGLFAVPAAGGTALPVDVPGLKGGRYFNPQFLPGGEDFLFGFDPEDFEGSQVYMATLRGGKAVDPRLLLISDAAVTFTPAAGGRLLYVRNDNVYSQTLDQNARKLVGEPELVQERVASYGGAARVAYFSISNGGTLAWRSGTAVVSQITIFDRKGNRTGIAGISSPINFIQLSPDESRLTALFGVGNMWLVDAGGAGRVAIHFQDRGLFWSPDGEHFICERRDKTMYERGVSDSHQIRELGKIPVNGAVGGGLIGVSSDGRRFLFSNVSGLSFFWLDAKRVMERIVEQKVDEAGFSPDGTWVIYHVANVRGVFARPISASRVPVQLSSNGLGPVWRADGKEILYHDAQGIWSVRVEGYGDGLRFSAPMLLFSAAEPMGGTSSSSPLAVSRDGSRIFYLQSPEQPDSGVINVRTGAIR